MRLGRAGTGAARCNPSEAREAAPRGERFGINDIPQCCSHRRLHIDASSKPPSARRRPLAVVGKSGDDFRY